MIQINGDNEGYIELRPGQFWTVPKISMNIKITNMRWVDSSHAYVNIQVADHEYYFMITQRTWYTLGDIKFNADVQIKNKRVNHILVQVPDSWISSTLEISALDAILIPINDVPELNRYGVGLGMRIKGVGTANLKIDWGTDYTETKTGLIAGFYEFKETLPPGTYNICAELFNIN